VLCNDDEITHIGHKIDVTYKCKKGNKRI